MNENKRRTESLTVLMAEDDEDDRFLIDRAFGASGVSGRVLFVEDGEELLDYLSRRGRYADAALSPQPSVILLDLKMPRKDGRQALWEIKQNPQLKDLPIVILTTSDSQEDKEYCADLGVSDFVTKPDNFAELIGLMKRIEALCAS